MTLDEIFADISAHMVKGMMLHDELAQVFDFFCLDGYRKMHEHFFYCESRNYREFNKYYVSRKNKLIRHKDPGYASIIPDNWYNYTRQQVDEGTKKNYVREMMSKWVNWERETKKMYERFYKELLDMEEVAAASEIYRYIVDVDFELKKAERYAITAETAKYDVYWMLSEQEYLSEVYDKIAKQ